VSPRSTIWATWRSPCERPGSGKPVGRADRLLIGRHVRHTGNRVSIARELEAVPHSGDRGVIGPSLDALSGYLQQLGAIRLGTTNG